MSYIHGPWHVDDWTIWGPNGEEIAAVSDEDGPLHRVKGEVRKVGPKSIALAEANARLIAAAPDLLEALEVLLYYAAPHFSDQLQENALEKSRAAIKKAKGE